MSERPLCAADDLIDGGEGLRFEVTYRGEVAPAFAIRFRSRVHAYLNRCAHVPVEIDWQPRQFFDYSGLYLVCAIHGALYFPESGRCAGGRCNGKGLTVVPVTEHDGWVFLIEEGNNGVG